MLNTGTESGTRINLNTLFIIFAIVISFVLIDISISSLVDVYYDFTTSPAGISLYVAITGVSIVGTYIILRLTKHKIGGQNTNETYEKNIAKAVWTVYYLVIIINVFVILQLLIFSEYYTGLLSIAATASYGLAVFVTALLAYHFLSWFKRNKSLVMLMYALASVSTSAYVGVIAAIFYVEIFIHQPVVTTLESAANFPPTEPGFEEILIITVPSILTLTTFLSFWGGTISILYANIKRVGKTTFWILVTTPIIFFLGTMISLFPEVQLFTSEDDPNSIIWYVYTINISQIIAITLFALAFVSMARAIPNHQISDFMYITCYGLALFAIGIIGTISGAGFPPFGLPTVSLIGVFSFLLFIGLHRSAISTAQDSNLRQNIRVSARQQLKLLRSMGTSEMERKLEKRVLEVVRANANELTQESGIEPTLSIDEARQYFYEALEEAKQHKQ